MLQFLPTEIPDVVLVVPKVHRDARGFFLETYHAAKYAEAGIDGPFVQDNHSKSSRGTLRGLHAQRARPQGKLVRAIEGEVFDVAVDVRPESPSFGKWVARTLSAENLHQLWVPAGFFHGFCVVSEVAQVEYKCTALYDPADEIALAWDDPEVAVAWPIAAPILSDKDRAAPRLAELRPLLAEARPRSAGF